MQLVCAQSNPFPSSPNINLQLGPFYARSTVGFGTSVTYTDNVDLKEHHPKSDTLVDFGPTIAMDVGLNQGAGPTVRLPGGEEFSVRLNLNVGTTYSVRSGLVQTYGAPISANATIPLYIHYLGWTVALSDNFNSTRRTLDTTFGFGTRDIPVYDNDATLSAYQSFGRITLTLAAVRSDQIVQDHQFGDQQYTRYSFSMTPSYAINETLSAFWANSYNITKVNTSNGQNSQSWSSSVGVNGLITRQISGSVSVGYTHNTTEGTNGAPASVNDGINNAINLNYANPLRPETSYSLSFFHNLDVPTGLVGSSVTEAYGANFVISHQLSPLLTLAPRVSWIHQNSLQSVAPAETVDIITVGLGFTRQFSSHLSASLQYNYQTRNSNINGQSYEENRVSISANYTF